VQQDTRKPSIASSIINSADTFYNELLHTTKSEDAILVTGPGLLPPHSPLHKEDVSCSYWETLFHAMIAWYIHHHTLQVSSIKEEFYQLSQKDIWFSLSCQIEEYFAEKRELQRCLKTLFSYEEQHIQFYSQLARIPFRGYISTTYDTLLEVAYQREHGKPLAKFYASSLQDALETSNNAQPFIFKPYGDIDDPSSIILRQRFARGLFHICDQEQLRLLFSKASVYFLGFERTDPDIHAFRQVITTPSMLQQTTIPWPPPHLQRPSLEMTYIQKQPHSDTIPEPIQTTITIPPLFDLTQFINAATIENNPHPTTRDGIRKATQPSSVAPPTGNAPVIEVFTVYEPADEKTRKDIEDALDVLKNLGWNLSCGWGRASIEDEWNKKDFLGTSNLILLLISRDFLKTKFCYSEQIKTAVERHKTNNDCCVIPIIARPASLWKDTPFGCLPCLPQNGKPFSQRRDYAWDEVSQYLKKKLQEILPYIHP
jgi:hypothetical protein